MSVLEKILQCIEIIFFHLIVLTGSQGKVECRTVPVGDFKIQISRGNGAAGGALRAWTMPAGAGRGEAAVVMRSRD